MPLLDHFHPPLSDRFHWESFHARWAAVIAETLDRNLPQRYFAEVQVHIGNRIEVDVASFQDEPAPAEAVEDGSGVATLTKVWAPPKPVLQMPALFPDSLEVLVFNDEAGPKLVAAIELVSPGNKDREEYRRAFAIKCAALLQQGIGLVIVDLVTHRQANLHNALIDLLETGPAFQMAEDSFRYAVAYQPVRRSKDSHIHIWPETLNVGQNLPLLPLPLSSSVCIPLDLEATYMDTLKRTRIQNV